jgi:hypothetical protein
MRDTSSRLFFLTGWPACGPAHYGEWLVARRDFQHLDLDAMDTVASAASKLWTRHVPGDVPAFVAALRRLHPRWVITAADPVAHLPHLEELSAAGFELWFLQARTESVSRLTWLQQERAFNPDVRPAVWERQAGAIRSHARKLRPFFRNRCVTTLDTTSGLMDGGELAGLIGAAGEVRA